MSERSYHGATSRSQSRSMYCSVYTLFLNLYPDVCRLMVQCAVGSIPRGRPTDLFLPLLHAWYNKGGGMCYPGAYKRGIASNRKE